MRYGHGTLSLSKSSAQAVIRYTVRPCPLGWLLAAATERGLCAVRLGDDAKRWKQPSTMNLHQPRLPARRANLPVGWMRLWTIWAGTTPILTCQSMCRQLPFQQRVWKELQSIPYGETRSYAEVAEAIDNPNAVRAVARACASNSVALVVPCHRVVRSNGDLGGYRWGMERKRKLLEMEGT